MKQKQVKSDTLSIYDYDKRIDRTYNLIRKELSDENIKLIENYDSTMINEQISKAGRHKHLQTLLNLSRMIGKDWSETTQSDINGLVKGIADRYADPRGKETHSSHDHKKVLKIFFRWFKLGNRSKNDVGDPIETKGIKIKRVASAITRDDLIISNEDRRKLVEGCNGNLRNEALIDCALDAGPRAGEILNLKLKHVAQDKRGYVLKVDGKTGQRPLRIIEASPKLAAWINAHPMKKDPDAPLWPQQTKLGYGKPLTYAAARQVVLKAADWTNLSDPSWSLTKKTSSAINQKGVNMGTNGLIGEMVPFALFGTMISAYVKYNTEKAFGDVDVDSNVYDFPTTSLHELGHLPTMFHNAHGESTSVMKSGISLNEKRMTITSNDEAALEAKYP